MGEGNWAPELTAPPALARWCDVRQQYYLEATGRRTLHPIAAPAFIKTAYGARRGPAWIPAFSVRRSTVLHHSHTTFTPRRNTPERLQELLVLNDEQVFRAFHRN